MPMGGYFNPRRESLLTAIIGAVACIASWAILAAEGSAADRTADFLSGLRSRGLHDVALDYLQQLRTSPRLSPKDIQALSYEEGITIADAARSVRDFGQRQSQLEEADGRLSGFVKGSPGHPLAGMGWLRLGRVRMAVGEGHFSAADRAQRANVADAHLESARAAFQEAASAFGSSVGVLSAQLTANQASAGGPAMDEIRQALLEAELMRPTASQKVAATWPAGGKMSAAKLKQAIEEFDQVREKYGRWAVAQHALVRQGECYLDLGEPRKALSSLDAALYQIKNSATSFELALDATFLYQQAALHPKLNQVGEAEEKGRELLSSLGSEYDHHPRANAIRFRTASAAARLSEEPIKASDKRRLQREALALARIAAAAPGEYQESARQLVAQLSGRLPAEDRQFEPDSFASAKRIGDTARSSWQAELIAKRSGGSADSGKLSSERESAIAAYRDALRLADRETEAADVNLVRLYLGYLYWDAGRHEAAAICGHLVATSNAQSSFARDAARLAMAAWQSVLSSDNDSGHVATIASRRLKALGQLTMQTWPDQPEAKTAALILVDLAARSGDVDAVEKHLATLTAGEGGDDKLLRAGQLIWRRSQERRGESGPDPATEQSLASIAQGCLEDALNRAESAGDEVATIGAAIAMVQIYLDSGDDAKALQLVEDPKLGLTKFALDQSADGAHQGLRFDACRTALRAYLSADPPRTARAEKLMAALDELAAANPKQAASVQQLYVALGLEMINQFRQARETGAGSADLTGLKLLMRSVAQKQREGDRDTVAWLATTYYEMAVSLAAEEDTADEATEFYRRAADAYGQILSSGSTQSADQELALRLRRGKCLIQSGALERAQREIETVLAAKPSLVSAQIEAARILQARGERGDDEALRQAMSGVDKIWGFGKLAQITSAHAKFQETFFESRFELARCRKMLADRDSATDSSRQLRLAKSEILLLARTRPALANSSWGVRFDVLLRQIQSALGEKQQGLTRIFQVSASDPSR